MDKSIGKTVKIHIIIHRIRLYKCDSTQHQMTQKRQCFSFLITLPFLLYGSISLLPYSSFHTFLYQS